MIAPAPVTVFPSPEAIGAHVASHVLRGIRDAAARGWRYLIGLPTGRSPQPVYAAMAAQLDALPQSLDHVTLVMMDEYLVEEADGFAYALTPGAPSCHAFTRTEIMGRLNGVLPTAFRIREESVWFPDPRDPAGYDQRISDGGGLDFFLLASGAGDGHVAFNPPGSALDSRTRIVTLSEQTRRDNLVTFPGLGTLGNVPRHGVSVGLATITDARSAMMVAWGDGKRETVRRMRAARGFESDWPATVVHACRRSEILIDRDADGG